MRFRSGLPFRQVGCSEIDCALQSNLAAHVFNNQKFATDGTCGFKPAGTGAEEKYSATIRESGKELPPGKIVLIWAVLGPAEGKMRAGTLAQRYVKGKSAPGNPSMLVGETNSAIALQFETNDGAATRFRFWSCSSPERLHNGSRGRNSPLVWARFTDKLIQRSTRYRVAATTADGLLAERVLPSQLEYQCQASSCQER